MKHFWEKLRGRWRLLFGSCPACNFDIEFRWDCPVCEWKKHLGKTKKYVRYPDSSQIAYTYNEKDYWWNRFIEYLKQRDKQDEELAITLMRHIMYDNGVVDRWHPEIIDPLWVHRIAPVAGKFFRNNRDLTDADFENICIGEEGEVKWLYANRKGFKLLNRELTEFFQNM